MIHRTERFAILPFVLCVAMPVFAQKSTAPTTGTTGGTVNAPTTTNNPINNPTLNPNNPTNPNNQNNNPFENQTIFLAGKVMFDDGSPMNKDVHIERVCGTNVRTEANVDSGGHFSFQIGGSQSANVFMDASQSQSDFGTASRNGGIGSGQDSMGGMSGNSRRQSLESTLWGCELRAAYPGYRSEVVTLAGRRALDDPNVGTIILHHLNNVQGTTISMTTALAPKSAQKNFEKGLQAARKGNTEEAEKRLTAATEEYPKYAVAWFMLGRVQEQQSKVEEARKSFTAALAADKKYVSPLDQLARLAARENKWDDAAAYSKQAIDLNPVEFPTAYWYNTVANYNLNKDADATKSAKALIKLDTQHRFPEANRLLAELALNAKDYPAAADYLKTYLAQVPTAKDADTLKQQLLKIEEARAPIKQ